MIMYGDVNEVGLFDLPPLENTRIVKGDDGYLVAYIGDNINDLTIIVFAPTSFTIEHNVVSKDHHNTYLRLKNMLSNTESEDK